MSSDYSESIPREPLRNVIECVSTIPGIFQSDLGLGQILQADSRTPNIAPFTPDARIIANVPRICGQYMQFINRIDVGLLNLEYVRGLILTARQHAETQIACHQSLLTPIRRLPVELLQLIFCHVHDMSTEKQQEWPVVARVCTFWREVANATPDLWTTINVDLYKFGFHGSRAGEMQARILRAGVVEVHLRDQCLHPQLNSALFLLRLPGDDFVGEELTSIANVLLMYSNSITALTIPTNGVGFYIASRYSATGFTCQNMRKLCFSTSSTAARWQDLQGGEDLLGFLCSVCPNLEHLEANYVHEVSASMVNWGKLKRFKGFIVASGLRHFLSLAHLVEDVEISSSLLPVPDPAAMIQSTQPPFAPLVELKSLRVVEYGYGRALPALSTFPRMPALRYLAICRSMSSPKQEIGLQDDEYLPQQIVPFLENVGSTLEYLALDSVIPVVPLKSVLALVPNLQGLRFVVNIEYPYNLLLPLSRLTHLELEVAPTSIRARYARRIFFKPVRNAVRPDVLMNKDLQSVAFYCRWIGSRCAHTTEEDVRDWEKLAWDLRNAGVRVHEYRVLRVTPEGSGYGWKDVAFDTDYFKDKGLVVGF